jgi:hypothetical protein
MADAAPITDDALEEDTPGPRNASDVAPSNPDATPGTSTVQIDAPSLLNPTDVQPTEEKTVAAEAEVGSPAAPSNEHPDPQVSEAVNTEVVKPVEPEELYALAGWNYAALEDNEINFNQGDVIRVLARANGDWWEGINLNKEPIISGYFPANRVKLLPGKPAVTHQAISGTIAVPVSEAEGPVVVPSDAVLPVFTEGSVASLDQQPSTQSVVVPAAAPDGLETSAIAETIVSEPSATELPAPSIDNQQEPNESQGELAPAETVDDVANDEEAEEEAEDPEARRDTYGDPLPPDWRKVWGQDEKAFYYYNAVSEETIWEIPRVAELENVEPEEEEETDPELEAINAAVSFKKTRPRDPTLTFDPSTKLPPDWEATRDEVGSIYYYNSATDETSWDLPGSQAAAGSARPVPPPPVPSAAAAATRKPHSPDDDRPSAFFVGFN